MRGGRSFNAYWMAETLRLRETHWGPVEDSSEVRRARAGASQFDQQVLLRAQYLGRREKLDLVIRNWARGARLALAGMMLAAIAAGAGAALGALGDGTRTVNLLLALTALLGLHSLTFVAWLCSFALKSGGDDTWLGRCWLWITQKLARGPDAALAPRALLAVLGRNNALRWVLGSISHGLWTGALLSLLLTLLAALSTRRYGFGWETTLLSADTFVHLTRLIGWLPAQAGFPMPSADMVRASNGQIALPDSVQALWSSWLIGCVVVYGLVPRLAALLLSLALARKNLARLTVDESLPAYAGLRERLQPNSEKTGMADPPPGPETPPPPHAPAPAHGQFEASLAVAIELPSDIAWPPSALDEAIGDLGVIDTRMQRRTVLDNLHRHPPAKLLIVCDSRQTPDRGTIALVTEMAASARLAHVVLAPSPGQPGDRGERAGAWRSRLAEAGFGPEQIHTQFDTANSWLTSSHADR